VATVLLLVVAEAQMKPLVAAASSALQLLSAVMIPLALAATLTSKTVRRRVVAKPVCTKLESETQAHYCHRR
jgi:hypothetical protein